MWSLYDRHEVSLDDLADVEALERLLGEKNLSTLKTELVNELIENTTHILVDMADYVRNDLRTMNKDVDDLQHT